MLSQTAYLESLSDARLVKYFLHGNRRAMEVLVRRYHPKIKKYLHTLLHNTSLEEEAMQKMWLEVLKQLQDHHYREGGHFKEWLWTLTFREAKEVFRYRRKVDYMPDEALPEKADAVPEEHFRNEEYLPFFKSRLSKMSVKVQQIVKLRTEHDMTFAGIDAALKLKPNEARVYFSRAMKRLRRMFEQYKARVR